jgi:ATP-dependent DNA helicase PIF1
MGSSSEESLRADVLVQHVCRATGVPGRSKQYRSTEILASVDDDGAKGLVVRTRPTETGVACGANLRGASIVATFAHEGKATIKLPALPLCILISKANPSALRAWLAQLAPFLGMAGPPKTAPSAATAARSVRVPPHAILGETSAARLNARARDESGDDSALAKRAKPASVEPPLNAEQQLVVDRVLAGESLFFTGAAGTGKSLVLRTLIEALPAETTAITAMTASAASLIGGTTLHAFAGVGNGERPLSALVEMANRKRRDAWRRATLLIVDEVSMLAAELLDKLEYVARAVRGNDEPFGGLQLLFCGDFFQLPPVSRPGAPPARFAFWAASWGRCKLRSVELTHVYRQTDDTLIGMLNEVRVGKVSARTLATLAACERRIDDELAMGVRPTQLFTHRADCDEINLRELAALDAPPILLRAIDSGTGARGATPTQLLETCPAKAVLELRVNAQVLLLRSLDQATGLVNGARGAVLRFERGAPVVRFACGVERRVEPQPFLVVQDGRVVATRSQVPLAHAWAISIHRSQGLSLDCLEVSLSRAFEYGQAYVALSRARSLRGLRVLDFDASTVRAHPDVLEFHLRIAAAAAATADRRPGDASVAAAI